MDVDQQEERRTILLSFTGTIADQVIFSCKYQSPITGKQLYGVQ